MLPLRSVSLQYWNIRWTPATLSSSFDTPWRINPSFHLRRQCSPPDRPLSVSMSYWLLKTEPDEWGWAHQTAAGGISHWDGVRNATAQKNMKGMRLGDLCFFYHTGKEKAVVGIVKVVKEWYPEPQKPESESGDPINKDDSDSKTGNDSKPLGEIVSGSETKKKLPRSRKGGETEAVTTDKVSDTDVKPSLALKWGQVDLQEVMLLRRPVSLSEIKSEAEEGSIIDFVLLRQQRLSVVPVSEHNWIRICQLAGQESTPFPVRKPESESQKQVDFKFEQKDEEKLFLDGKEASKSKGRRSRNERAEMRDILKSEIDLGSSIEKPKQKRTRRNPL